MIPASESGRSLLAAWSTPADAKMQISIAKVAPSPAHTRCMSWKDSRACATSEKCSSTPMRSSTAPRDETGLACRTARNGAGHRAQRMAQVREGRGLEPAGDAFLQMTLNEDLRVDREFAVVIRLQILADLLARKHVHHARTSLSCWRRV